MSYRNCSIEFLLQILKGAKKVFAKSEIGVVQIRNFKEIRMRAVLAKVLPHAGVEEHFSR